MEHQPLRPRFDLAIGCPPAEAVAHLRSRLDAPDCPCVGRILGEHVDLAIPIDERHLWSPCLQMEFAEREDGTVAHVLVGPHPNVWTMFAFSYGTIASAGFFALMLGVAQIALERSPWGLWLVPVAIAAVVGLHMVSRFGQRFAADQIRVLRSFAEDALEGVRNGLDAES